MARNAVTVSADTAIHDAIQLLLTNNISAVPVVDAAGGVFGILSEKDCFRIAFEAGYHQERGGRVGDYMSVPAETVDADDDIASVAHAFLRGPHRRFPVVSEGRLVGVLARSDALRAVEQLR